MLALPFQVEFQSAEDFSLEFRTGESIFLLTLQDFHKSYFKELFISCLVFVQLLSLIWTLSFAHFFSTAAYPFIALSIAFFIRRSSTSICPSHGDHTKFRSLIYLCIIPISHQCSFFLNRLESKTAVVQANTTDLFAELKISEVFRCLFGDSSFEPLRYFSRNDNAWNMQTNGGKINPSHFLLTAEIRLQ